MESLRGSEGIGAKAYFDVFDEMILQNKADFSSANETAVRRSIT